MSERVKAVYESLEEALSVLSQVKLAILHPDEEDNTDYVDIAFKAKSAVENAKRELKNYAKEMKIEL